MLTLLKVLLKDPCLVKSWTPAGYPCCLSTSKPFPLQANIEHVGTHYAARFHKHHDSVADATL